MLTIKPRTQLAGLHAGNGRAASEVVLQTISIVGSGIRVVILGDSSPISVNVFVYCFISVIYELNGRKVTT